MAMEAGVDGVLISNHGGRTLDTAPAAILMLLELHRSCHQIFEKLDVMVDGDITRGTDVLKAPCPGTKAVGLEPFTLHGLNYGYEGVVKLFESKSWLDEEILRDELEAAVKLRGVTRVDQLHAGYLNTLEAGHSRHGNRSQISEKSTLI
ncbi:hypothetical protein LLEC1_05805 [Akanthomyces lecanii]|uniref:FMN hydroxy acid dehydrogenase domain-containing protein n=1 Tax=Cordyceps confragosa TaxID=2714763 RepID=A0A179I8V6_CORDF|nr:hypothetical protein LLEC1_05805 [Akanthomyces lecanii]